MSIRLPCTEFEDKYHLLVKQVISEWQRRKKTVCVWVSVCVFVCVHFLCNNNPYEIQISQSGRSSWHFK